MTPAALSGLFLKMMDSATKSLPSPRSIVVMGVAGCGKSSLAQACAQALGWQMFEGDDFHAQESLDKMRSGIPLSDDDRAGWLDRLGAALADAPQGGVLACSALRQRYRDRLRSFVPGLRFVFLDIDEPTARRRVASRPAHLFPSSLVASQFATLEPPADEARVLRLDATEAPPELTAQVLAWLSAG